MDLLCKIIIFHQFQANIFIYLFTTCRRLRFVNGLSRQWAPFLRCLRRGTHGRSPRYSSCWGIMPYRAGRYSTRCHQRVNRLVSYNYLYFLILSQIFAGEDRIMLMGNEENEIVEVDHRVPPEWISVVDELQYELSRFFSSLIFYRKIFFL